MNKNIVTYLDRDLEVKQISERDFIKEFENNIKKLCIELFHIHKNDISLDNLIDYMKSFLLFYDILQEKKINHIELKEQLKSIMDYVFRDEDINEVIRKIKSDLQNNKELKEQYEKSNIIRQKEERKRLNEYYIAPSIDNKDNKNLYKIKDIALTKNKKDRTDTLEKSFENKYNRNLEKLNTKEKLDKKDLEITKPIIVNIDNKTGMIIDDRD
jgi:translation initiation factor 2B subunit (eIF-2B alpha/beta/delta family)